MTRKTWFILAFIFLVAFTLLALPQLFSTPPSQAAPLRVDPTCHTYAAPHMPMGIPETGSITSTFPIASNGWVYDVKVDLTISHTSFGDLSAKVCSTNGCYSDLFLQGDAYGSGTFHFQFSETAEGPLYWYGPDYGGAYYPVTPFDITGRRAGSIWSLQVVDGLAGDEGTLEDWSVTLCTDLARPTPLPTSTGDPTETPTPTDTPTATGTPTQTPTVTPTPGLYDAFQVYSFESGNASTPLPPSWLFNVASCDELLDYPGLIPEGHLGDYSWSITEGTGLTAHYVYICANSGYGLTLNGRNYIEDSEAFTGIGYIGINGDPYPTVVSPGTATYGETRGDCPEPPYRWQKLEYLLDGAVVHVDQDCSSEQGWSRWVRLENYVEIRTPSPHSCLESLRESSLDFSIDNITHVPCGPTATPTATPTPVFACPPTPQAHPWWWFW